MKIGALLSYMIAAVSTTGIAKAPALALRKRRLKAFLSSSRSYTFPTSPHPRASFVVTVFNNAHHTLECLLSVLRMAEGAYEVIIIDDGSSDETLLMLARFKNVKVHRNAQNLGYLRSVNVGAELARGQYLVLINSDARLIQCNLTAALDSYEAEENCGMMGARVRHVGGGLQEAGSIIYQDGTTNGYLRYQSENDPRAMYQRDVDYCSGVFAIIARQHFESLKGFDEAYAPAYFEETDYCMRLREKGLRCIYNPHLLVDHFEFGSSKNAKTARKMIEMRRSIFLARWAETLKAQQFFPRESSKTRDSAALRLLPHPRRLVILDAKAAGSPDIQSMCENKGHLTFFVLGGTTGSIKRMIAKTGRDVAWFCGSRGQLRRFVRGSAGVFDVLDASANVDADFVIGLRKSIALGNLN